MVERRPKLKRIYLIAAGLGCLLFSYQNCSQASFSTKNGSTTFGDLSTSSSANPNQDPSTVPPPPAVTPPSPQTTTTCNPFGSSSTSVAGQGLYADGIYYVSLGTLSSGDSPDSVINNSVESLFGGSPNISKVDVGVYLNALDVPDVYFASGFTDSKGKALDDADGNILIQYFGFRLHSVFTPGNWAPGDYQIAILSDDGSILTMNGAQADGSDLLINNDGLHSMEMKCSSGLLHVTANSQYYMTFDWIQGPPITLGFMMLYRPVSLVGSAVDPLCGQGGNSDSYFFLDHDSNGDAISPSLAQAPYKQLSGAFNKSTGSGGWTVVEPEHFTLPAAVQPQQPACN